MIDGVLTYSTVNENHQVEELVDLNKVVAEVQEDLEILIQQKRAQFKIAELPVIRGFTVPGLSIIL